MKGKASTLTTIEGGKRTPQSKLELFGGQTRLQTFTEILPKKSEASQEAVPYVPTRHPAPDGPTPLSKAMETFTQSLGETPASKTGGGLPGATIPYDLAVRAFTWSSMNPEGRALQVQKDFENEMEGMKRAFEKYADTPEKTEMLESELAAFKDRYAEKYKDWLGAVSRTASPMVTGPARFPTERNRKALDSEHNKYVAMTEFKERAMHAIRRRLKEADIEAVGGPLEAMKLKLADAVRNQERMKQANAILRRSSGDEDKVGALQSIGYSEALARELMKPDFAGRSGYTYELTNNNANIRRMQERIAAMERKEATPTTERAFQGGTLVDSLEDDRVQLVFDAKPSQSIIDLLKQSGFRWSPSSGAWQRQRTANARYAADRIIEALASAASPVAQTGPASASEQSEPSSPAERTETASFPAEGFVSQEGGKVVGEPWALTRQEFYEQKFWHDPEAGRHPASGSGRLPLNRVPFFEREGDHWRVVDPYRDPAEIRWFETVERAKEYHDGLYEEYQQMGYARAHAGEDTHAKARQRERLAKRMFYANSYIALTSEQKKEVDAAVDDGGTFG